MRLLTVDHVLVIHRYLIDTSGGSTGLRDRGLLESAVAQPALTFGGHDLYPSLVEKAGAIGHALIANHPFVDGNKRIGHASIEATLMLNGYELAADVDDAEATILAVAAGSLNRSGLIDWVREHMASFTG